MKILCFVGIAVILLPLSLFSTSSPAILLVQPDAKTAALGEAHTGIPGGINSIFFNPAGTISASKTQVSLTHYASFAGINYEYISSIFPHKDYGVLTSFLLADYTPEFSEIDENGNEAGRISSYDVVAGAGYSANIISDISAGINIKYFFSKLYKWTKSGMAFDMGVMLKPASNPDTFIGVSLMNLGKQTAYISSVDSLPTTLRVGMGFVFKTTPDVTSLVVADYSRSVVEEENPEFGGGLEVSFWNFIKARGGCAFKQYEPVFTAGMEILLGNVGVSYAFVPYGILGITNRITMDYSF